MKLTLSDFSGGLTDSPSTSDLNCAEIAENVLINKDKTLRGAPGADLYSTTAPRLPTNSRVSKWAKLPSGDLIAFSDVSAFLVKESGITELLGPTGNPAFNEGDANSIVSTEVFNGQLICTNDAYAQPIKIYNDQNGATQLRTAGLPQVSANPTITPSVSHSKTYIYAFVLYYEYRVGSTLFVDYGSPRYITSESAPDFSGGSMNAISGIPTVSNGVDYNHDEVNVKTRIFRTTHTGTAFYYVGEVANGVSTYNDTITDAVLLTRESLYVNGGIRPNDFPSPSKYILEANDTYYYLDVLQSGEAKPFRLLQSVSNDPDSVPSDFFTDFKGALKGGGVVGRGPVVFTEGQTIRLDGLIDETGRGFIGREVISATVGLVAHNSVVKTSKGLYFAGTDGFYYTDGYSAPTKLAKKGPYTSRIDAIYKDIIATDLQKSRIQGIYDVNNNRAYWTVQQSAADNDAIFVYDETHDAFTVLRYTGGILPTAIMADGEDLLVGDSNGYLFRLSDEFYNQPVVDTSLAVSSWIEAPIIYKWKSVQLTMGDGSVNKWITKLNVQGMPETNLTMGINSYTNGEDESKALYPVRVMPGLTWGDSEFVWNSDSFVWNRISTLNQTRNFASGRLRARSRQIEFTNAYYTIASSTESTDSYVTVDSTLKTVTLVSPTNYSFGANNEGYDFIINDVSYEILSGTADTLVLDDPSNTLVTGNTAWSMMGFGKGQRPHILNFSVEYEILSDAGTSWKGGATA